MYETDVQIKTDNLSISDVKRHKVIFQVHTCTVEGGLFGKGEVNTESGGEITSVARHIFYAMY